MSALPSPSTATLIALESAFATPDRNLTMIFYRMILIV